MNKNEKIIISTLLLLLLLGYKSRNTILKKIVSMTNEEIINELHPKMREQVRLFLFKCLQAGIVLRLVDGYRSHEEQAADYAQGRTKPGKVITNAKPGESYHNYALAFDVVPIEGGKAAYNTTKWDQIGKIGKSLGLVWGGDFRSFKDRPHFQYNVPLSQLQRLYATNNKTGSFVNIV